jgi:precorrin-3B synthase
MTARAIFFSQLRGACPGLSVPMQTGDGLLLRLLAIGTIPLDRFRALCAAAGQCGNGVIEITGRGSIQVRGLNAASAPRFADTVAALNIAAADGTPVISNALAALDPEEVLDAAALAADVRGSLARTSLDARLAPKVSVVIDGGGTLSLGQISADVRLCAEVTDNGVALRIGVGGDAMTAAEVGLVAPSHGIEAAVRLLEVIARHGRTARACDIVAAEGVVSFRSALSGLLTEDTPPPPTPRQYDSIGLHPVRDGHLALGIGLTFGHADARTLERLADAAKAAGAIGVRPAASRTLMIIGLTRKSASAFTDAAEVLGFIVDPADPRCHVIACAGAPVCSSAQIAARALAPQIAEIAATHLGGSRQIHISGCNKGCARPGRAALTIVGSPCGYGLIADGSARDSPFAVVAPGELPAAIERYFREPAHEDGHV